jgi:hypothetical protein
VKPDTLHRSGLTLRVGALPYGSSESTTSRNDSGKPAGAFLALEPIPPLELLALLREEYWGSGLIQINDSSSWVRY